MANLTKVTITQVLAIVERSDTIAELATKLDHSESYLSRAIADLVAFVTAWDILSRGLSDLGMDHWLQSFQ